MTQKRKLSREDFIESLSTFKFYGKDTKWPIRRPVGRLMDIQRYRENRERNPK